MSLKQNTYIICNGSLIQKLKKIQHFKLNLGKSLTDTSFKFNPNDINIQKHYLFFNKLINMIGYIGALPIYSYSGILIDDIYLYNDKEEFIYHLDDKLSLYDNINLSLDLFFTKIGLTNDIKTTIDELPEIKYIKPDKSISELSLQERILYLRNN